MYIEMIRVYSHSIQDSENNANYINKRLKKYQWLTYQERGYKKKKSYNKPIVHLDFT